jgi:hypothetical protein
MNRARSRFIIFLASLAVAWTSSAADAADPLELLGIGKFECRCSQSRQADSDRWLWLFVTEPEIGAVDPDGPSGGRLRAGDVLVAVDGWMITTRAGGERFSQVAPGVPVELTVRRGGFEHRETIVPRLPDPADEEPELDLDATSVTVKLAELSESLEELARISSAIELPRIPELPEFPDVSGISVLGDLEIDTRPLGWFGIGISFSGTVRMRRDSEELPLWQFDAPPKVHSLDRGGPAARAGLRRGDVLTHIDGARLDTEQGQRLFSEIRPGQTVVWTVRRRGAPVEIPVTAEEPPE